LAFSTLEALDSVVSTLAQAMREIPRPASLLAAKAYVRHRTRGGSKLRVLLDFFIGAHAAVEVGPCWRATPAAYRTYFPTLEMLTP